MTMLIDKKHFFMQHTENINMVMGDLIKNNDLTYFQFAQVFSDDGISTLTNRPEFLMAYLNDKKFPVQSYADKSLSDEQSYHFFWDERLLPESTAFASNEFDIAKGICFVERYKDHYNLIAFATSKSKLDSYEFYSNNICLLKSKIQHFKERYKNKISEAASNRLFLNKARQDINKQSLLLQKTSFIIKINNLSATLCGRELDCLYYLSYGYNIKEIAKKLLLSPRTVETYLNRIKNKLYLSDKKSLIHLSWQNNIPNRYTPVLL